MTTIDKAAIVWSIAIVAVGVVIAFAGQSGQNFGVIQDPEILVRPGTTETPSYEESKSKTDPFEGISDEEISKYSKLFEISPPENDNEAKQLSSKIREWIRNGKPKPEETRKQITESKIELENKELEKQKPDKEEERSKKKRGRFGFFRK